MAILSPSILSCDYMNMQRDFEMCKNVGCKWLHVDIMDGHFVPNITFGPGNAAYYRSGAGCTPDDRHTH